MVFTSPPIVVFQHTLFVCFPSSLLRSIGQPPPLPPPIYSDGHGWAYMGLLGMQVCKFLITVIIIYETEVTDVAKKKDIPTCNSLVNGGIIKQSAIHFCTAGLAQNKS